MNLQVRKFISSSNTDRNDVDCPDPDSYQDYRDRFSFSIGIVTKVEQHEALNLEIIFK